MNPHEDLLERLAEQVADGVEIDRAVAETAEPGLRRRIRSLRRVAEIGAAYRRLPAPVEGWHAGPGRASAPCDRSPASVAGVDLRPHRGASVAEVGNRPRDDDPNRSGSSEAAPKDSSFQAAYGDPSSGRANRDISSEGSKRDPSSEDANGDSSSGRANEDSLLGQWGSLRLRRKVGGGSYGEVFLAHDPALDRIVALKLLHPERIKKEQDVICEGRNLARVRHRNVLAVHGADKHAGRLGVWSDFIEGKTLEECLRDQGPFGAEEATLIGIDLARALAAVHRAGLVHRDVKTTNVMRETGGRIVLMDFSSAAELPLPGEGEEFVGTGFYMAPELFEGRPAGAQSDLFALGTLLFRLVTGRFPVEARDLPELVEKRRRGEALLLNDLRPDLPVPFVRVIHRALAADPGQRYATAGEFEQALVQSMGTGSIPHPARHRPRSLWLAPAALALLAALAVWRLPSILGGGAIEMEAALFRRAGGVEEQLRSGSTIGVGDQLYLVVEGTRPFHLYVFNEDVRGEAYVLFPLPDLDLRNPLPGRQLARLPGAIQGIENYWDVTTRGGREALFVIASKRPLPELERELAQLPVAGQSAPQSISGDQIRSALRGIGGLSETPEDLSKQVRFSLLFEQLERRAGRGGEVWTWKVELENP